MAASKTVARQEAAPAEVQLISDETRAMFAQMVSAVPEADGSGVERILLAILNAADWDALDDPWDTTKTQELLDVEIVIHSIMRRPSRFADGLGVFLVARGKRLDDDREIVFTTGSISVVGQLVRAYMLDAYPLYAILRQSDGPTERGYYPHHLEITASAGARQVAA